MVDSVQTRITAAEFFDLPDDQHPMQLIDGELIEMQPPVPEHQRIIRRLLIALAPLIPNGELFTAPLAVYLDDDNVPEPNVTWVAADSRCQITATRLEGAPDLVVEVLSPSTTRHDKTVKFHLYERHGVREYWIIDPVHRLLEVWQLIDQQFTQQGIYGPEDTFESPVLDSNTVELKAFFGN